ncbi:hypothetical protein OPQ81_006144 [Rhizoctonia solani]|nr:hypothetical protein OPQ81_006144 [Rhizoctonia solani]
MLCLSAVLLQTANQLARHAPLDSLQQTLCVGRPNDYHLDFQFGLGNSPFPRVLSEELIARYSSLRNRRV